MNCCRRVNGDVTIRMWCCPGFLSARLGLGAGELPLVPGASHWPLLTSSYSPTPSATRAAGRAAAGELPVVCADGFDVAHPEGRPLVPSWARREELLALGGFIGLRQPLRLTRHPHVRAVTRSTACLSGGLVVCSLLCCLICLILLPGHREEQCFDGAAVRFVLKDRGSLGGKQVAEHRARGFVAGQANRGYLAHANRFTERAGEPQCIKAPVSQHGQGPASVAEPAELLCQEDREVGLPGRGELRGLALADRDDGYAGKGVNMIGNDTERSGHGPSARPLVSGFALLFQHLMGVRQDVPSCMSD